MHALVFLSINQHMNRPTNTKPKTPISLSDITGIRRDRRLLLGVISIQDEKSSHLRLRLKLFIQVAARQLKDRSFQIFGILTENALSAMTERHVRTAEQQFVRRSQ